jgi:hypothetical protein
METGKLICVVLIIIALFLFATSLHRVYSVKNVEQFDPSVTTAAPTTAAPTTTATKEEIDKLNLHKELLQILGQLDTDQIQQLLILTKKEDTGVTDQSGTPVMKSVLNKLDDLQEPIKNFNEQKSAIETSIGGYADLSDDQRADLSNLVNGLTNYREFHDRYNKELEIMLENRFKQRGPDFLSKYDLNKNKIDNLKTKIDELKGDSHTQITSNIISVKNLNNGERLNLKKIKQDVSNGDGSDAQRYLIFANNNCLTFNGPREYSLKQCEMTDQNQHFLVDNIKNNKEYEVPINIIKPDGVKKQITEFDEVSYDFNLVYPYNSVGSCLSINENGMQFVPCSIENNQRFNISDRASAEKCN